MFPTKKFRVSKFRMRSLSSVFISVVFFIYNEFDEAAWLYQINFPFFKYSFASLLLLQIYNFQNGD